MKEAIELSLETPNGIADCRLDADEETEGLYHATILYPNVVNGFSRSEIFCYDLEWMPAENQYRFVSHEEGIHPQIMKLEKNCSDELKQALP